MAFPPGAMEILNSRLIPFPLPRIVWAQPTADRLAHFVGFLPNELFEHFQGHTFWLGLFQAEIHDQFGLRAFDLLQVVVELARVETEMVRWFFHFSSTPSPVQELLTRDWFGWRG